jgi:hypothetical protein
MQASNQNSPIQIGDTSQIRDENGTDTAGYRVIPYPTLMYFSRIWVGVDNEPARLGSSEFELAR